MSGQTLSESSFSPRASNSDPPSPSSFGDGGREFEFPEGLDSGKPDCWAGPPPDSEPRGVHPENPEWVDGVTSPLSYPRGPVDPSDSVDRTGR